MEAGFVFFGALAALAVTAQILVKNASRVASALGLSPLLIGMTIVAYGTSLPEIAVAGIGGRSGATDLALAVIVGSNIFNVLGVLGLSSALRPVQASPDLIRRDLLLLLIVSVSLSAAALDGNIGRVEGSLFFVAILLYTTLIVYRSIRNDSWAIEFLREFGRLQTRAGAVALSAGICVAAGALLILGAIKAIESTPVFAARIGLPVVVVALTLLSVATSVPELFVSALASQEREPDVAVSNIVGSNIFNILAGVGIAAMLSPTGLPVSASMLYRDLPILLLSCAACLPFLFAKHRLTRWHGFALMLAYAAYLFYVLFGSEPPGPRMLFGIVATIALPLLLFVVTALRGGAKQNSQ